MINIGWLIAGFFLGIVTSYKLINSSYLGIGYVLGYMAGAIRAISAMMKREDK